MREILFRGKRIDNGNWEYGQLKSIHKGGKHYETAYYILNIYGESRLAKDAIEPNTLGQFTGLTDKNGKKIFEGDIVKRELTYITIEAYISWDTKYLQYRLICINGKHKGNYWWLTSNSEDYELIGNIYDNPELLEVDNG